VAPSNVARVDEHRNLLLWNRPLDHQSQPAEPLTAHQG
jgi:hypothetical protein